MPKFEFTWTEKLRTVIEAESREEAWEKLNDGGEDEAEFIRSDDYQCREVVQKSKK